MLSQTINILAILQKIYSNLKYGKWKLQISL